MLYPEVQIASLPTAIRAFLANSLLKRCLVIRKAKGFPGGSAVKNLPVNAGDVGSIAVLGRSSEEGNGNPLEYSCLGNPIDRGAWQDTVYENAKELDTTK